MGVRLIHTYFYVNIYLYIEVRYIIRSPLVFNGGDMSLAKRLRELRANKAVSLQAVADVIGATKPHIWELEKGRTKNPSLDLLKELALYYGVTLDFLAGVGEQDTKDVRYNALLRKLDPESMTESDWKVVEQAMDFAANVIADKKKELDN